jgi:hypothetical protein
MEETAMPTLARAVAPPFPPTALPVPAAVAAMAQGALAAQAHLVAFAGLRLQREVEAACALAACRTPPEAVAVAQRFCAQALEDYAGQARALASLPLTEAPDAALRPAILPE